MDGIIHIEEFLDKSTFPTRPIHLHTRFGQGTLLVYWVLESQYTEYIMTIERYLEITKDKKVTFNDFRLK